MSAITLEKAIEETAANRHDVDEVDVTAWITHQASLYRAATGVHVPRHRADGPAR